MKEVCVFWMATVFLTCAVGQTPRQEAGAEVARRSSDVEALLAKSYQRQLQSVTANAVRTDDSADGYEKSFSEAMEKWRSFREAYCRAISQTYGGAWAGVHEAECKIKLAQAFIAVNDEYSW